MLEKMQFFSFILLFFAEVSSWCLWTIDMSISQNTAEQIGNASQGNYQEKQCIVRKLQENICRRVEFSKGCRHVLSKYVVVNSVEGFLPFYLL